jgi:polyisoprenoid-binding protein YceI
MRTVIITLLFLTLFGTARAEKTKSETYELDPVHSRVVFFVSHAGFARAIGTFSQPQGSLTWSQQAPEQSSVSVSIPLQSLELGDAEWNKKILGSNYLNEKKYPIASFKSENITITSSADDSVQMKITGVLSINNQQQSVTLEAVQNKSKRHPLTLKQTIGVSARTTISRKAFGVDAWPSLIGDEVEILIETEWVKDSKGGP